MKKAKGCINKKCIANNKKTIYTSEYDFCLKCGNSLHYVCKDCYTELPSDSKKHCIRCIAKNKDVRYRILKLASGTVMTVGFIGKKIIDRSK